VEIRGSPAGPNQGPAKRTQIIDLRPGCSPQQIAPKSQRFGGIRPGQTLTWPAAGMAPGASVLADGFPGSCELPAGPLEDPARRVFFYCKPTNALKSAMRKQGQAHKSRRGQAPKAQGRFVPPYRRPRRAPRNLPPTCQGSPPPTPEKPLNRPIPFTAAGPPVRPGMAPWRQTRLGSQSASQR